MIVTNAAVIIFTAIIAGAWIVAIPISRLAEQVKRIADQKDKANDR